MSGPSSAGLEWKWGSLSVDRFGGRVADVFFLLSDGRGVAPLHMEPWSEAEVPSHSPLLRRLRGEWPCVPFGFDVARPAIGDWAASSADTAIDIGHGFSASNDWTITDRSDRHIALSIDYPEDHPVARLERIVRPDPDAAAVDLTLAVKVRRDCALPIGLHPVLRLPPTPQSAMIEIADGIAAATFPGDPAGPGIFEPGRFATLDALPLRSGGLLDARLVPLSAQTVEIVQLLGVPGRAALWNRSEGYRLVLAWNAAHFPSLLLWYSNYGHRAPPWNGRHLALGMEPVCSAFDLGVGISTRPNPINMRGVPTARSLRANETFVTSYRLSAEAASVSP